MYRKLKERITETTQYYLLRNVHPRAEQPFQVRDDEEMQELVESIWMNGVLNPLIVTPRRGGYEIVSGHRRYAACQKLSVETVLVIVHDLDPDEATLCMIVSNLHREHLLPSEKAYAYKAKMEVLNRQKPRRNLRQSGMPPQRLARQPTRAATKFSAISAWPISRSRWWILWTAGESHLPPLWSFPICRMTCKTRSWRDEATPSYVRWNLENGL